MNSDIIELLSDMPAGNTYPSEHLVPSFCGTYSNCWNQFPKTCRYFQDFKYPCLLSSFYLNTITKFDPEIDK